jgi:hypothetical protein
MDSKKKDSYDFGSALALMRDGVPMQRAGWNGKGLFVFMQMPAEIPQEIIPKMQSLPGIVKGICHERNLPLKYSDQFALVHPDNSINGWTPSPSDATATDWQMFEE